MQKPPLTFEEFLQSQGLKSWPRCVSLDEPHSLVDKLQKDCSFNALSKSLYEHVPLNISSLSDLENRINSCITELKKHAEKIHSLQCGPAYLEEQLIDLEQKITSEQTDAEKLLIQTSEMQKVKVAKYIVEESKGINVEPNQEDQDHFFDRIAENFVVLFLLVPRVSKGTFFSGVS
ncbi:protein FAM227B [Cygnus olor]|uniref:protein FAM227B n=1 Tax=Cygnus olor TaxID=8869 RepID=UPI001ADE8A2F|nr:protein FAM227B [Cygnus olor]